MASLGWLLNLGFAGSGEAAAAGPAVGSLLLLGVGRGWLVPLLGIDPIPHPIADVAAGGLMVYAVIAWRDLLRRRRRLAVAVAVAEAVAAAKAAETRSRASLIVSMTAGAAHSITCLNCGKCPTDYYTLSDGTSRCLECA